MPAGRLIQVGLVAGLAACGSEPVDPDGNSIPAPDLQLIFPDVVVAGQDSLILQLSGSDFTPLSTVRVDNTDQVTTFLTPSELTTVIAASALATPAARKITVFTPPPGGGTSGPKTLRVIDAAHPAGTNIQALGIGGTPHGVSVAPNGVFCASQITMDAISCGVVTATGQSVNSTISVGAVPAHVAVNPAGTVAYTANQSSSSVSVVDLGTETVTATIDLSDGGFNLLVSPDGGRLYVTTASGTLHIIDTGTNGVLHTLPVGAAANGLAFDSVAGTLYASARDAGTVKAISAASETVQRTYFVSSMPQRIALSLDRARLYVANESSGLDAVDVVSGTPTTVNTVDPQAVGLAVSPDGLQLYVCNPPLGKVQVIDASSGALLRTIPFTRPRNVTFTRDGKVALITDETGYVMFVR
jgi:YVTN family beta-propeller protein